MDTMNINRIKMRLTKPFLLSVLVLFFCWQYSSAKIVRIEITGTEVYDGAKKFGDAGEYIKISGWAYGEVDPRNSLNSLIQDIQLAPRNVRGKVEYVTQFILLRPTSVPRRSLPPSHPPETSRRLASNRCG